MSLATAAASAARHHRAPIRLFRPRPSAAFAAAPLDWTYDTRISRYRGSSGRFLGAEQVVRLRDTFMEARVQRTADLAASLADGTLHLGAWEDAMREEIKVLLGVSYAFGRGGFDQMQPADFAAAGKLVAAQYAYLNEFAKDIQTGTLSHAQIVARAALYTGAGTAAYERGAAAASGVDLLLYPGEGTHPSCRCSWQIDGPLDDGHSEAYWIAEADCCDVCGEHAAEWNPLVIPAKEHQ